MASESYNYLDAGGQQFQQCNLRHNFCDWVWDSNGSLQFFETEISA
jgi:hypothetical protein